ncbi:MAG: PAS domain S-box protein [Oscillatoriaceae cyanobacterium Prado104]|nr:PAS domain S-box protein [Oscillatoriaceae cyanobacterium Prado104]
MSGALGGRVSPDLGLYALFNSLAAIAYWAIASALVYFASKLARNKICLLLAAVFAVCGAAQFAEIWMLWHPIYWLWATLKATSACLSLLSAALAIALVPKTLSESNSTREKHLKQLLEKPATQQQEEPIEATLRSTIEPKATQQQLETIEDDRLSTIAQQLEKEITARQQAEEKLQLTQMALDRSADAIFRIGPDGKFLYVNDAACSSLGYSPTELLSLTIHDINPDFPETAWNLHWNVLRRCGSVNIEVHHMTKYGRVFPVEITIDHLQFNGKEYQCAFARDISDRKQIEAALREREAEFRSLVSSIPGAVYRCGVGGRSDLTFISSGIEEIAGYPAANFLQKPVQSFTSIINPDDVDFIDKFIVRAVQAKQPYTLEYRLIHENGNIKWVTEKGQAILSETGDILSLNGVIFDITERKQAENALRLSEAIANNRAQQLEIALKELRETQSHLIHSEKMSLLGQMVAGVAHEINNPVSFIYGNISYASQYIADLLKLVGLYQQHYPEPTAEVQDCIENMDLEFLAEDLPKILGSMKIGADRIREIVLSLRNFSRLDDAVKQPAKLDEGIDNTLLILHNRLRAKAEHPEIKVVKNYEKLPLIECYAGQLNQVFMNLLSNAIDALEEAWEQNSKSTADASWQPTICIRTEKLNSNSICIRIADNAAGMTEEVCSRLFDPFFTTKPLGKGTGLGLSISYRIVVEKHGGQLKCNSVLGEGTEFAIELPLSL